MAQLRQTSLASLGAALLLTLCGACTKSAAPVVVATRGVQTIVAGADTYVPLDVDLAIPAHATKTRSRLVVLPEMVCADTVTATFEPVVVDGTIFAKKMERRRVLDKYEDPYAGGVQGGESIDAFTVTRRDSVCLPAGCDEARVYGVVTTDGCGMCSAIDTVEIARVVDYRSLISDYVVPENLNERYHSIPKIMNGKGAAKLNFIVDKWDIVPSLGNNRRELQSITDSLGPILRNPICKLTSLEIFGTASAEAPYDHNVMLAENRAASARDWLVRQLNIPADVQRIIKIGAAPEGWEPVVQAMIRANDPDSALVRELMIKYPGPTDDAAEVHIRKLKAWPRIVKTYLPHDRKVTYRYTWELWRFANEEELRQMWYDSPELFDVSDMLYVAWLVDNEADREDILRKVLAKEPNNVEARHRLGKMLARRGDTRAAMDLLSDVYDLDTAALALALGDYDRARRSLDACADDHSPRAEKLRKLLQQ